jgi:hypothetical protein
MSPIDPTIWLAGPDGLARVQAGLAGGVVAVARSWLAVRHCPGGLAEAQAWAPWGVDAMAVHAGSGGVTCWAWPADAVRRLLADHRMTGRRVLPVTAVQPAGADGPRLVAVEGGFDGQMWRDGVLRASRFWEAPPTVADWRALRREAGLPASAEPASWPTPIRLPFRRPWVAAGARPMVTRHRPLAIAAAVSIALIAFTSGEALRADADRRAALDARAEGEAASGAALAARRAEADARERAAMLAPYLTTSSPLDPMADLLRALPPDGWRLVEWQAGPTEVRATFATTAEIDPLALVAALERLPWVRRAQVDGGPVRGGERPLRVTVALR